MNHHKIPSNPIKKKTTFFRGSEPSKTGRFRGAVREPRWRDVEGGRGRGNCFDQTERFAGSLVKLSFWEIQEIGMENHDPSNVIYTTIYNIK